MFNTDIVIKSYKLTLIVLVNLIVWLIPSITFSIIPTTPTLIVLTFPIAFIGFISSFILLVVGIYEIAKEI